jgi:ureidoacrylate peracid hydrolase
MTGVLTNQCVESTIRDAQFRDFEIIELFDCVGTLGGQMRDPITKELTVVDPQDLHKASLRAVVFGLGDVVTSDELMAELSRNK